MILLIEEVLEKAHVSKVCELSGRITRISEHSKLVFFDLSDVSQTIQITLLDKNQYHLQDLTIGSYAKVKGTLHKKRGKLELRASSIDVIAKADLNVSPNPWRMDGLSEKNREQVIGHPDIYLSNPQRMAVLQIVDALNRGLDEYFHRHRFTRVVPPILTSRVLYGKDKSIKAEVHEEHVFLTQCSTFELEPLALAFKKVYTISPAFRNEKGGSKRHLAEYTHAKAEMLEATYEDLIKLASMSLHYAFNYINEHAGKQLKLLEATIDADAILPQNQERITYIDALKLVQSKGSQTMFGKGLTLSDEKILTNHFGNKYVWVLFNPNESEGFPYRRHEEDPRLSMTCDLIAPHGAGEMVGVAEKITDTKELIEKMLEKGLGDMISRYADYLATRSYGLPPHGGIGLAPERIVYGLLGLDHIIYTKAYPCYPDRKIVPNKADINPWKDTKLRALFEQSGVTAGDADDKNNFS